MEALRARRLKLEASKAQLAEGEEILVKCNALCQRDGPVLRELYDASGTPAQCTIDCAAAYGEFFLTLTLTPTPTLTLTLTLTLQAFTGMDSKY